MRKKIKECPRKKNIARERCVKRKKMTENRARENMKERGGRKVGRQYYEKMAGKVHDWTDSENKISSIDRRVLYTICNNILNFANFYMGASIFTIQRLENFVKCIKE